MLSSAAAQSRNPIQAAKEAYNRSRQQQQRQQQTVPQPANAPSRAPVSAASTLPAISGASGTAEATTGIAVAASFLDEAWGVQLDRSATDATREYVEQAARARADQEKEAAKQNRPKL